MGQSSENVGQRSKFDRQLSGKNGQLSDEPTAVGERTNDFLRRRYPERTAERVAADLRHWPADTIAKMLERQSTPSGKLMLALTVAYGPEYLCAILDKPPLWVDAARRQERQRAYEREAAALRRKYEDVAREDVA